MRKQIDKKSLYYTTQGSNTIYYSYNTTVAVKTPIETYVSENVWSYNRLSTSIELRN